MSKSIKFIFHKVNRNDNVGYIYLQHIKDRNKSYRSLGLPKLNEKQWDEKNQRVKKSKHIDYTIYNELIEKKHNELLTNDKEIGGIESFKNRKSFLSYFESIVKSNKLITKHGTRLKYRSVLHKLREYLNKGLKTDVSFSELNLKFLDDFQVYMKSTGMDTNTVTHYLKIIRVVIRKSQKEKEYTNVKDPFVNFTFERKEKKTKETLSKEEIQQIKDTKLDSDRMDRIRKLFLFQFFTNGMRVSDLSILRFNNLSNGRINYKMFKTHNEINIPITELHIEILKKLLDLKTHLNYITIDNNKTLRERLEEVKEIRKNKYQTKQTRPSPIKVPNPEPLLPLILDLNTLISYGKTRYDEYLLVLDSMNYPELFEEYHKLIKFNKEKGVVGFSKSLSYDFSKEYEKLKDKLENYIGIVDSKLWFLKDKYLKTIITEIHNLSKGKKTKNNFVFQMLKDEDFSNVDEKNDFSLIDFPQYQKIHKSGVLYNRHLKELQKLLGMKKSFRTHLPRISFTNIMMKTDGVNHTDISKSLGHSSVSITDVYLETGFDNGRGDNVQKKLEDQFK